MIRSMMVIAKQPIPGRVKTRLIGHCTAEEAAELASCALLDTLTALQDFPCQEKVILLDGVPDGWLPAGWQVIDQVEGGLDQRLSAGFEAIGDGPALLVGMDTPQLRADQLDFDPQRYDACLGPASDGGFWTIGFADPRRARSCIQDVPMSTDRTGAEQLARLVAAGMSVQKLVTLTDVDTAASAAVVAELAPWTSFARRWNQIPVTASR